MKEVCDNNPPVLKLSFLPALAKGQRLEWTGRNIETEGSSEITLSSYLPSLPLLCVYIYIYVYNHDIRAILYPRNILNSWPPSRFRFYASDSPALLHRCSGMLNIGPRGPDKAVLLQGEIDGQLITRNSSSFPSSPPIMSYTYGLWQFRANTSFKSR